MDIPKFAQDFERAIQKLRDAVGSYDEPDSSSKQSGFTVVLDNKESAQAQYQDAPLFAGQTLAIRTPEQDTTVLQSAAMGTGAKNLQKASSLKKQKPIPEQIRRMRNLYQPGNMSFNQRNKNFYTQGKFMENYEDNEPWDGALNSFFISTYHDLSLDELRGYFTWRTELRKGNYQDHCGGFAQIYLDELINGIGVASAEESLRKMQEFERGFLDAGFGRYENRDLREKLNQRMIGFAVLNKIPLEVARKYIDGKLLARDTGIEILHRPKKFSDQEVFNALCMFGGKKTAESKLIQRQGAEAVRFFAAVWRLASAQYRENGKMLFTLCFGSRRAQPWHPLEYTLYYDPKKKKEKKTVYELNPSRSYRFTNGSWYISTYQHYYFNRKLIVAFLHETDRRLRLYLKAGNPLKEQKEAAWAVPYIEAVIEEDRQAKLEAARPKITIDFAGLEKIRQDALETQGSLLTEEDTQGTPAPAANGQSNHHDSVEENRKAAESSVGVDEKNREAAKTAKNTGTAELSGDMSAAKSAEAVKRYTEAASDVQPQASAKAGTKSSAAIPSGAVNSSEASAPLNDTQILPSRTSAPLDNTQVLLLRMLLRGALVPRRICPQARSERRAWC